MEQINLVHTTLRNFMFAFSLSMLLNFFHVYIELSILHFVMGIGRIELKALCRFKFHELFESHVSIWN